MKTMRIRNQKYLLIVAAIWMTMGICSTASAGDQGHATKKAPAGAMKGILAHGHTYTLMDLYRIALKNSEQIQISGEDVNIAEEGKAKAFSPLVPRLSVYGSYTQNDEGTTVGGSVIQPESVTAYGLKLSQSITLNGREILEYDLSKRNVENQKLIFHSVKESYLFQVTSAYYDVLRSMRTREIAQANVKRLTKHRDAVSTRLEVEEVTRTDLFRAEAELSKAQADLISSTNQLRLAKVVLARLVGIPKVYEIRGPGDKTEIFQGNLAKLIETGWTRRAEMNASQIREAMADIQVKTSRSGYFPVLSAEGAWAHQETDPSSSLSDEDVFSVTLSLTFNLFDGGLRRAQVGEALAQKRQAELSTRDLARQIAVEVEQVYLNIENLQEILKSLEDQLEYSRQNYNAVTRQFIHGLANSVDVMDANTLLVTSEKELSETRYKLQLAILEMQRVTGTFLDRLMTEIGDETSRNN